MDFTKQLGNLFRKKKRRPDDDETDIHELSEAGVSVPRGDPRLKGGLRQSNMSEQERKKLRKYRGES